MGNELTKSKRTRLNDLIMSGYHTFEKFNDNLFRVGYCSQCGQCCCNIDIRVPMDKRIAEWLTMHEHITATLLSANLGVMSLTLKCENLIPDKNNPGKKCCNIYENRPSPCVAYPRNESKFKECTYVILNQMELTWFLDQIKKIGKG